MDKAYKESYRKLGLNIAFYRKDRGLTQMQLAELLDIDRSHMSAIELATVGVSLDVIFKMCNILVSTEQIPIFAAAIKSAKSAQTGAKGYAGFYADSTLQSTWQA